MSVTATYTDSAAKVTVVISSAPGNAQTVLIERSPDQVTWTTVRGASALPLVSSAVSIDDYEFSDGVLNYYRATYFDSTVPTYGTASAIATTTSAGASATVTPALPAGASPGHMVFVVAACTKVTAAFAAPAGWTGILAAGSNQFIIYAAPWTSSLTAPAMTATGLASGDKLYAKTFTYRNASAATLAATSQANTSAVNIAYAALSSPLTYVGFRCAFIRSINTSVTPAATTNDTGTGFSLLTYQAITPPTTSGSITVAGGSAATSEQGEVFLNILGTFIFQESNTVTPALSTVWIKNPLRPYLNRKALVIGVADTTHDARSATFDVVGRSLPVAVTDLFAGKKSTLTVRYTTRALVEDAEQCLLTGETQFVHAPKGAVTPSVYCVFTGLTRQRPANTTPIRYLVLPYTEVAAPSPLLGYTLSSWQTVISTYATWNALVAAKATWNDVLSLVGSPTDLITG